MGWATCADQSGGGSGCNDSGNALSPNIWSWGRIGVPSPDVESDEDPNGLECGRWYRVEANVRCLEPGCMNQDRNAAVATAYRMRIYDASGALILGDGQMRSMSVGGTWLGGTAGATIEDAYDDTKLDTCFFMSSGRPSFHVGNNGQATVTAQAEAWMYFDRIGTSTEGWIGP